MKRVVNIAKTQEEAYEWDIKQALRMSVEERQKAALALKKRVYGQKPDIKEWGKDKRCRLIIFFRHKRIFAITLQI